MTDFPYPVTRQPPFTPRTASLLDFIHRQRLRSLQAVDEAIATLVWQLKTLGQLDNTYFIYTSDNGYHIGHRRQKGGKRLPYEEDTRVPLFIRGPGIPPRSVNNDLTTMVDLAPTILKLAGGQLREDFDGMPLRLFGNSGGQSPQGQPPYEDPTYVRDT